MRSLYHRRRECLPTRYPAKTDIVFRTVECGYFGPKPPPQTVKEACRIFHERNSEFREQEYSISQSDTNIYAAPYSELTEDETHAIECELRIFWDPPARESGSLSLIL